LKWPRKYTVGVYASILANTGGSYENLKKVLVCAVIFFFLGFSLNPLLAQSDTDFEVRYFIDEFGDLTDHAYLAHVVEGTFSDSATQNSKLLVVVLISDNEIGLSFREYGKNIVSGSDYDTYVVKLKLPNGEIFESNGNISTKTSRLYLSNIITWSVDRDIMFNGSNATKFFIYEKGREYNNYLFSIVFPSLAYVKEKLGENLTWIW